MDPTIVDEVTAETPGEAPPLGADQGATGGTPGSVTGSPRKGDSVGLQIVGEVAGRPGSPCHGE